MLMSPVEQAMSDAEGPRKEEGAAGSDRVLEDLGVLFDWDLLISAGSKKE